MALLQLTPRYYSGLLHCSQSLLTGKIVSEPVLYKNYTGADRLSLMANLESKPNSKQKRSYKDWEQYM
jgi:hypothetical protein